MKILLVSSYLPYPLLDGGRIRLYNILKYLQKQHEITLVCEKRTHQSQQDIDEVSKVCKKVIVVDRPKAWSVKNVSKAALTLNPLLTTTHTNKKFRAKIEKELLGEAYDLIHVETFYVMQNLPKVNIPVVLVEHNIEYQVYEKFVKNASIFIRPALMLDVLKLKRAERKAWKKADLLVAVSPAEQKIMGPKTLLVPNGVDIDKFKLKKLHLNKITKKILFIGNFKWVQNKDSVTFIIKNIWPRVLSENKNKLNIKLWVVGKNIPSSVKELGDPTIEFDENAPDETEKIYESADVLLSPIRIGGGTNFKILESMAVGTPVITSALGNEGINAEKNSEIIVCDKPEEYSQALLKLINDNYLYEKMARKGRVFIEEKFDWKNIAQKMDSVYRMTTDL